VEFEIHIQYILQIVPRWVSSVLQGIYAKMMDNTRLQRHSPYTRFWAQNNQQVKALPQASVSHASVEVNWKLPHGILYQRAGSADNEIQFHVVHVLSG